MPEVAEKTKLTWKGKPLSSLSDSELSSAVDFYDQAYEEISRWAPPVVWAPISSVRSDLIIELAKRTAARENSDGLR